MNNSSSLAIPSFHPTPNPARKYNSSVIPTTVPIRNIPTISPTTKLRVSSSKQRGTTYLGVGIFFLAVFLILAKCIHSCWRRKQRIAAEEQQANVHMDLLRAMYSGVPTQSNMIPVEAMNDADGASSNLAAVPPVAAIPLSTFGGMGYGGNIDFSDPNDSTIPMADAVPVAAWGEVSNIATPAPWSTVGVTVTQNSSSQAQPRSTQVVPFMDTSSEGRMQNLMV